MIDELVEIAENGSDEEKEILALTAQAIKQKRERNSAYLSGFLGLKGRFIDDRTYQFIVPNTVFMQNRRGTVHGGIAASIADSTIGSLVNQSLSPGQYAVTTEMKINYIRPGTGSIVRSEATILHKGSKLVYCTCSLYDDRDRLFAHATGSFMVLGQEDKNASPR